MTATWPTRGKKPYGDELRAYIDEAVTPERVASTLDQEPVKSDLSATTADSIQSGETDPQTAVDARADTRIADGFTVKPALYKPRGLRRWRIAYADARNAIKSILVLGDSRSWGVGSDNINTSVNAGNSSYRDHAWPSALRKIFAERFGDVGEGFIPMWDYRWTFAGSTFAQREWGALNYGGRQLSAGEANYAELAAPVGTTRYTACWWDGSGKLTLSEDGGTAVANTPGGTQAVARRTRTGLAGGSAHTIRLAGTTGSANVYTQGVICMTEATAGVRVHRVGYPGADTGLLTALSDSYVNGVARTAQASGFVDHIMATTFGGALTGADGVAMVSPSLTIVYFDVNDWSGQANSNITPAIFKSNLARIITEATVTRTGSLLFVCGSDPVAASLTHALSEYRQQLYDLADANDHVSVLNISDLWGTQAQSFADGIQFVNSVHFQRPGHYDLARVIHHHLTAPGLG